MKIPDQVDVGTNSGVLEPCQLLLQQLHAGWEAQGLCTVGSQSFPKGKSQESSTHHLPLVPSQIETWRCFISCSSLFLCLLFLILKVTQTSLFQFVVLVLVVVDESQENTRHFYLQLLVCSNTMICALGVKEFLLMNWEKC